MRKIYFTAIILPAAIALVSLSCGGNKNAARKEAPATDKSETIMQDSHSSQNSLDWQGVYSGVIPCADCEGIEVRIALKRDGSFTRNLKYLGKEQNGFSDEGKVIWDESGSKITLKGQSGDQQYQVGETWLLHLNRDGNRITGDLAERYRLAKNRVDPVLEDKNWILTELMGKPFETTEGGREGSIMFSMETGSFSGNNTCNNFFGQYELMEGDRISFGMAGSTRMACPDQETEQLFMEVLEMADNYTVAENVLSLNKVRMAPLARFKLEEKQ
jgi:heat shock protein HslJ